MKNLKLKATQLITRKNKGDQNILVVLGLCVVGTFLLLVFKDSANSMVISITNSVNETIKGIFTNGM